jgi:hypothetical protein
LFIHEQLDSLVDVLAAFQAAVAVRDGDGAANAAVLLAERVMGEPFFAVRRLPENWKVALVDKRIRHAYALNKADKSGAAFPPDTPELGYVAIDSDHRGKNLSHRIVAGLIAKHTGPLFATTSSDRMKATLTKVGFVLKGHEWQGGKAPLSLWWRES